MRVIAGEVKGRTLVAVKGGGTRSATDRLRETLFAILEPEIGGARVLDLFAGAGTLGIEALSRGAAHATFVERGAAAVDALRKNLAATGYGADRAVVHAANVLGFLESLSGEYDLVFCDPPYADSGILATVLAHPRLRAALAPEALVVARAHRKHLPVLPEGARLAREKEIGEESLLFLRYDAGRAK
jgi:16S rRNA (guanine966-N2)-methyltransferase